MESFFLAETVKYLWLLFDLAAGPDNIVENGPYKYIFSTEGHLLPMTPKISLVNEHCLYFGAYCKSTQGYPSSSYVSKDGHQTASNSSRFQRGLGSTSYVTKYGFHKSASVSEIVKGMCHLFPNIHIYCKKMSDLDDASNDPDAWLDYENMDLENFVLQNFTKELESRKRSTERISRFPLVKKSNGTTEVKHNYQVLNLLM